MFDQLIFTPRDIDTGRCPVFRGTGLETYILGAFNPALCRLPGGNLLMMVRVAEALRDMTVDGSFRCIRWDPEHGYTVEKHRADLLDTSDPRKYRFLEYDHAPVYALTSFSWLLPVELTPDGTKVLKVHYDRIIEPRAAYQEFGVEDPRITLIEGVYYMTACSVSSERHSTVLYRSENGLDYELLGIILDHQNKDMVLFPEKTAGKYTALTRPLGELYFMTPASGSVLPGTSINLAESPDLLHWKPSDRPFIRQPRNSKMSLKLGGGAPPVKTPEGWLLLFHGVDMEGSVGRYRTFSALVSDDGEFSILRLDPNNPVLEASPTLTEPLKDLMYVEHVVFTTGLERWKNKYIVASGECDLACRITHLPADKLL